MFRHVFHEPLHASPILLKLLTLIHLILVAIGIYLRLIDTLSDLELLLGFTCLNDVVLLLDVRFKGDSLLVLYLNLVL